MFGTIFQNYKSFEFTIAENAALNDFGDSDECRELRQKRVSERTAWQN